MSQVNTPHVQPFQSVSENIWQKLYSTCQDNTNYQKYVKEIKCCAVCGMGFPNFKFKDITISQSPINQIPNSILLHDENNQPILHTAGIIGDNIYICSQDMECLQEESLWKYALANNNFEGIIYNFRTCARKFA